MTTRLHALPCYSERELRGKGLPGEFTTSWLLRGSSFRKLWLGSSLPKFCFPVIGWYSLSSVQWDRLCLTHPCLISSINAFSVPLFIFFNITAVQQDESHSLPFPGAPSKAYKTTRWCMRFFPNATQSRKLLFKALVSGSGPSFSCQIRHGEGALDLRGSPF